ncbi:hypothetical protein [Portibacter marinus]|uniref:hypothetical protein n=1 Tax=Portibacter marinus TaxID=2898660 RepID=UPI001F2530C8|nr:hypothetical protein [Portibacter marinus]
MKVYKVIAVLALLIAFPAISYWYLMRGYNFRLDALQKLETKAVITDFNYGNIKTNPFKNRASLVFDGQASEARAYLEPVFEEFSDREEFQMIGFVKDSMNIAAYPANDQWITLIGHYPYEQSIALIDTASAIRNYYTFDSLSFKDLIQHIPIIIPRKKEKDIVLKREDEK